MDLVFLYGPPGVGKLTTARELARITGYKLWHSHVSIDAILPLFGWDSPSLGRLVHQIRGLVHEEAASQGIDVITTFVYAHPHDASVVQRYFEPYERRGGRVCPVQLTCEKDALDRRVRSETRATAGKVATLDLAADLHARHDLRSPLPGRASLRLDNTRLAPEATARRIAAHYDLPLP